MPSRSQSPSRQQPSSAESAGVTVYCMSSPPRMSCTATGLPSRQAAAFAKSSEVETSQFPSRTIMSPGCMPPSAAGLTLPSAVSTSESETTSSPSVEASMPTVRPTGTSSLVPSASAGAASTDSASSSDSAARGHILLVFSISFSSPPALFPPRVCGKIFSSALLRLYHYVPGSEN